MPVRKKNNKKNIGKENQPKAIVPKELNSNRLKITKTAKEPKKRVTALSTSGRKKRPSQF